MREATNKLIELVEEGVLSWESIARAALVYMSEDEVADMAQCNELLIDDFEDEDDEDDELCDKAAEYVCTLDGYEVCRFDTYREAEAWCNAYDGDKHADIEFDD